MKYIIYYTTFFTQIPTGKRTKSQECVPRKDLVEEGAKKQQEHPRSCSVEPMEINMTTMKDAKVLDIDSEDINAEFSTAEYAKEINLYLKQREVF